MPSKENPQALTSTLHVRIPTTMYRQLEDVAHATARTTSLVMLEALSNYLQAQGWEVGDIEAGMAEADRGEFATDTQVRAVFAKYGA